ncbi:hypothetical protein OSL50_20660 [Escherichia coli]|uniref:Uncharacterized protein n=1 Tax=Escherichia coli TaxID=562 RepID=A0AAI9H0N6_ECOLX|nr:MULTISPECIES: hypothetical protein [Escherichia]HDR9861666.1 hypothetical protein [Escherichia coli O10 str. Bi8337-41]EEZ7513186.1 hypothetical protein [Escherichia coli]EFF0556155.1 hypothetical protein [Escherichia coli]EFK4312561.1 hypothetical protein [Escherichia coli]EFK4502157.1 hypothetical protein [Escherichia coli]
MKEKKTASPFVVTAIFLLLMKVVVGHTKLCTGLQGVVLLLSATCFYVKKLAQEDKKSPCANALLQVTNII